MDDMMEWSVKGRYNVYAINVDYLSDNSNDFKYQKWTIGLHSTHLCRVMLKILP